MSTTTNEFYATSSFETQATFDATQQLEAYLANEFDPGFRNFLNDLPELNGVSYTDGGGMEVTFVTSSIVDMSCTPQTANNYCYNVRSNFGINYASESFSSEYVSLIMASGSNEYIANSFNSSSIVAAQQYTGAIPRSLSANITLTLVGVPNQPMKESEWSACANTMGQFLRTDYSRAGAISDQLVISIRDVAFVAQMTVQGEKERRMLQLRRRNLEATSVNDADATLYYSSIIRGEYLPPPEINDFDDVVVETFVENENEFVEILQPQGDFFAGISSVSANETSAMMVDSGEKNEDGDDNNGVLIGIIVGVVVIVIMIGLFAYAKRKLWIKKKMKQQSSAKQQESHLESLKGTRTMQASKTSNNGANF
eukprot:CAMPEP_0116045444 /NCGR_PEP_ID=MMETSP0321-20121206/27622_1 /TAXON_ID=163516 /ORGANISM="Leptocylindrus danicus var. danicus, Strain B650" /LENGTH=368 /DNA_ID=CAMNT_0003526779 /DNA_START=15 /DNA_END=1121 /DNA_ORIENTATION=-